MFEVLALFLGFMISTIADRLWFKIPYKKIEKGVEFVEHYHFGLAAIMGGILLSDYHLAGLCLAGLGMGLIYHEAKQENLFAIKAKHSSLVQS